MRRFVLGLSIVTALTIGQLSAGTLQVFSYAGNVGSEASRIGNANAQLLILAGSGILVDKENFEGFTALNVGGEKTTLATGIGTFQTLAGNLKGGNGASTKKAGFTILDQKTSPFNGRYNVTSGGKNWLDSNDNTKIGLSINPALNNLYFFMTDEGDSGGKLTITTTASSGTTVLGANPNGTLHLLFWQGSAGEQISSIEFSNSSRTDGYGLDRFGTIVPEPSFYALSSLFAGGLLYSVRRKRKS